MVTGITIFVCIVVCCVFLYIGYLGGCKFATEKVVKSFVDAMFDMDVNPDVIEKVINRGRELIRKEIKGE